MTPEERQTLERIVGTQRNIKIYGGVAVGILLLFYFFTFPQLIDRVSFTAFMIETGVAVVLAALFFIGNRISFVVTKLLRRKDQDKALLQHMGPRDVLMDLDSLAQAVDARR